MAEGGVSAETLLGVAGIGAGVLLLYGAYKNVPIFGANGLIVQAITTGKFPHVPRFSGADAGAWAGIIASESVISSHDANLGRQISQATQAWNPASDPTGSAELRALLAQAEAKGGAEAQAAQSIRVAMATIASHTGAQAPPVNSPTGSSQTVNI